MRNNSDVFQVIGHSLNRSKIPFVLVGGFAMAYYEVARQTADIDFFIPASDWDKIVSLLASFGYVVTDKSDFFMRLTNKKESFLDIDFIFTDKKTLAEIIKAGKRVRISNEDFTIPSLEHLLAMKLHSLKQNFPKRQAKDIPDILSLAETNQADVKGEDFRKLCLEYGNEVIYQKIMALAQEK